MCSRKAVWFYAAYDRPYNPSGPFCEKHVSRGCSCNTWDGTERLDFFGRRWPCHEWDYRANRFWKFLERITLEAPWRRRKEKWFSWREGEDFIISKRTSDLTDTEIFNLVATRYLTPKEAAEWLMEKK